MPHEVGVREMAAKQTRQAVVAAAAQAFVEHGVQAPVRDIAGRAAVGVGTVYRHFPSRGELVTAVYRHQIDECVTLADELAGSPDTTEALTRWIDAFVDFLVTKHGLGAALQSDDPSLQLLHSLMLDRLVPACGLLVDAAVAHEELDSNVTAHVLMRAVGNLCVLGSGYDSTDAKTMVARLLHGCRPSS